MTENTQKRSRWTLVAILVVAVLPVAAAYFMYFTGLGVPQDTVNNGRLLDRAVSVEALLPPEVWAKVQEDKKWRLLHVVNKRCESTCQERLYTTRQVHIRLGEKSVRVARMLANVGATADDSGVSALLEEHPRMVSFNVDEGTWQGWMSTSEMLTEEFASEDFYLLVDQQGLAMMAYTNQHGNDLLVDIKRALKFSIDYQ